MRIVKFRKKWAVYVPGKNGQKGKRYSLRTADYDDALGKFEDFKRQYEKKRETVGEIVEAYLEEKKHLPSFAGMRDAWGAAKANFKALRPEGVTYAACRVYAHSRDTAGISAGTIRKEIGLIRQALRWQGYTPEIELPPAPPPKDRYLTKPEYRALLEACTTPHIKLFVQLALGTGARKGAILDLQWKQVDLERGIITLSKGAETNKRRATVPINETLKTALQGQKNRIPEGYVITFGGNRVKSVNIAFRRACKRAGLEGVSPHTLRHTAAVWMAEAGVPMAEIAQFLGHTSEAMTFKVYARYSPTHLRKAAAALEV